MKPEANSLGARTPALAPARNGTRITRRRARLLTVILAVSCLAVAAATIAMFVHTVLQRQTVRLRDLAQGRARLADAMARHCADVHDNDPLASVLKQLQDAHIRFAGFEKTVEFAVARRDGDRIDFLFEQRPNEAQAGSVAWGSGLAAPMERALEGQIGEMFGRDYRGAYVLAAYAAVPRLNIGMVAKNDLSEILAPPAQAALLALGLTLVITWVGVAWFRRVAEPMVEQVAESEARVVHLNAVLRAIRNVNQLIVREKDRERMLQQACALLIEARGFRAVFIVRVGSDGRIEGTAEAGLGAAFAGLRAQLERGEVPECCRRALVSQAPVVVSDLAANCADCALAIAHPDAAAVAVALRYEDRVYGVLVAALPVEITEDAEELSLFSEVAGDLAFALHDIALGDANRKAEAEIRSLARFPAENPNPVLRLSRDGKVLYANDASAALLRAWGTGVGSAVPEVWCKRLREAFERGASRSLEAEVDGRVFTFVLVPVINAGYANLFGRDITDQSRIRALEERMRRTERLVALGEMIASLAHTINNPLSVVYGNAQFLCATFRDMPLERVTPADWKEIVASFASIEREGERCRGFIASTLQIVHHAQPNAQAESTDVNRVLTDLLRIYESQFATTSIRIVITLDSRNPRVTGDPDQLQQVFLNLITNARQAMAQGGTLEITTEQQAGWLTATISDTGPGIKKDLLKKIFDPFFTTKPLGSGTGLGLPIASSIVTRYGGTIEVQSEEGHGATFLVRLPLAEPARENMPLFEKEPVS